MKELEEKFESLLTATANIELIESWIALKEEMAKIMIQLEAVLDKIEKK